MLRGEIPDFVQCSDEVRAEVDAVLDKIPLLTTRIFLISSAIIAPPCFYKLMKHDPGSFASKLIPSFLFSFFFPFFIMIIGNIILRDSLMKHIHFKLPAALTPTIELSEPSHAYDSNP